MIDIPDDVEVGNRVVDCVEQAIKHNWTAEQFIALAANEWDFILSCQKDDEVEVFRKLLPVGKRAR